MGFFRVEINKQARDEQVGYVFKREHRLPRASKSR